MTSRHPLGNGIQSFLLVSIGVALFTAYMVCLVLGQLVQVPDIDIPFHLAGGAWVAWVAYLVYAKRHSSRPFLVTVVLVLLVAFAWEAGEWSITTAEEGFHHFFSDETLRDVFFTTVGGTVAAALCLIGYKRSHPS